MAQKVISGLVRLSYLNYLEPRANKRGDLKYSTMILVKKSDTKTKKAIDDAIEKEFQEKKGFLGIKSDKLPKASKSFSLPWHDGDDTDDNEKDDENLHGHWYMNASSNDQPGIVDRNLKKILDPKEIYSGMFACVSLNVVAFNNEAKGITAFLNNIQKVKDGPRLDGRTSAESDFKNTEWDDEVDGSEDDEDDYVM